MIYDVPKLTSEPTGPGVFAGDSGFPVQHAARNDRPVLSEPTELPTPPPLFCTLYRKEGGGRTVTVTEGRVIEIIPDSTDGVIEHEIVNLMTAGLPTEFDIDGDTVVGVYYSYDENGYIDEDVEVQSIPKSLADDSKHYTPPVGRDTTGVVGWAFVKLVELDVANDKLTVLGGGTNVYHYHDTPPFSCVGGGLDVFKQYNLDAGRYEYSGFTGKYPIDVYYAGEDIEIALAGGADFDLTIYTFSHDRTPEEQDVTITIPAQPVTIESSGEHGHTINSCYTMDDGGGYAHPVLVSGDEGDIPQHQLSSTGSYDPLTRTYTQDGQHDHVFTIPERTVTAKVTIQTYKLNSSTDFIVYCWRAGIFVGEYPSGAQLPEYTPDTTLVQRKIWVWNGEENDPSQQLVTPI